MPLLLAGCAALWSQTAPQNSRGKSADTNHAKQIFSSTCAQCHGLDGKGSERGPNIADRPGIQRLSDARIFHIVQNGVPGTGMPAFHSLQDSQVRAIIGYLRTLQGRNNAAPLPGNPELGKAVFFGRAGCSECHMVGGQGGFIASDLSEYARGHTVEEMRSAVVNPGNGERTVNLVTAILRSGQKYVGRVRNEDNFSIQLQALDGSFYFLLKSEIATMQPSSQPLMPSDYGARLDTKELNNLISYLMSVADLSESSAPKKSDEWEE